MRQATFDDMVDPEGAAPDIDIFEAGPDGTAPTDVAVRRPDPGIPQPDGELGETEELVMATSTRAYTSQPVFKPEDLALPRLRLAQGLTNEVQLGAAKPGDWVLIGHEGTKAARVTPVMMATARELRIQDSEGALATLCQSRDAVIGVGVPGGECAVCPMAQWTPDPSGKSGKNRPPQCSLIYSYMCWSHTHDGPCVVEFRRTATRSATFLNTLIASKKMGRLTVELASEMMQGPRGPFYVPRVTLSTATAEELAHVREAFAL